MYSTALYLLEIPLLYHKMPHRTFIPMEDKQRIVYKYKANEDFLMTAANLGIKRTSAYTIIRRYQKTGSLENQQLMAGRKKKFWTMTALTS